MAMSFLSRVTCIFLGCWFVVQADNTNKGSSTKWTHDDPRPHVERERGNNNNGASLTGPSPLSPQMPQRRKRTMASGLEEMEESPSYPQFLSAVDDEKRAKSSFRGDLGKRMLTQYGAMPVELEMPKDQLFPGRRIKLSSRFRGDLGKRARSAFRGDLGKRGNDNDDDDDYNEAQLLSFLFNDSADSFKYRGSEAGRDNDVIDEVERQKSYPASLWKDGYPRP